MSTKWLSRAEFEVDWSDAGRSVQVLGENGREEGEIMLDVWEDEDGSEGFTPYVVVDGRERGLHTFTKLRFTP